MKYEDVLKVVIDYIDHVEKEKRQKTFQPGEDWVRYSGPVFDREEHIAMLEHFLTDWLDKNWLIFGENARKFEQEFVFNMGKKFGVFANSGSSANLLMSAALTSKRDMNKWYCEPGSKFITPIVCFPTTINPLIQMGFEPVFVGVDMPSLNLNLDQVEQTLKEDPDIRGITFAHVLGNPPDMDRLMQLVDEYDLIFLEDSCDALGSFYDGKRLGSFGLMSTCSFFPAHHMTTGEGGFVATDEYRLKTILNSFRDWGRACYCNERKPGDVTCGTACGNRFKPWFDEAPDATFDHRYVFDEIGYNIKPLDLQAIIGLKQQDKLPRLEKARRSNFERLKVMFEKYNDYFLIPEATEKADPCWFGYLVALDDDAPFTKQEMVDWFESNKIQTRSYFSGNILYHPGYKHLTDLSGDELKDRFPNAHKSMVDCFFMGTFEGITSDMMNYIEQILDEFMERYE